MHSELKKCGKPNNFKKIMNIMRALNTFLDDFLQFIFKRKNFEKFFLSKISFKEFLDTVYFFSFSWIKQGLKNWVNFVF